MLLAIGIASLSRGELDGAAANRPDDAASVDSELAAQ